MWKFAEFFQARGLASLFDTDEEHLYLYMCSLHKSKAGATTGNSFLSAFRFTAVTFGLIMSQVEAWAGKA